MPPRYILALDQGTTSSRSLLFDAQANAIAQVQEEFPQIYPQPGWVSHDPMAIWSTQLSTARQVMQQAGVTAEDIAAIGITNQRETTVIWDRETGKPIADAVVWQCRRTAPRCDALRAEGREPLFRERTGLVLDAYFSGTKVEWLLDNIPEARERAERGELCFGTIDSWLLFQLTGVHATDYSNASRTLLFNIHTLDWDDELLQILHIPRELLPEVHPTCHVFGHTGLLGGKIPVAALAGDQQAALFGHGAFDTLDCKNTYGTGCFLLVNTGESPRISTHGLLTTIAWGAEGKVTYALEGSVFVAGALIQWLRDELGILATAAESEVIAASVPDTGGVCIVPAFVGLGAPYWDMHARGTITGLTRGTSRAHLVRAALEAIAHQSADLLESMEQDLGSTVQSLKVDGGASQNDLLLQIQSDLLGRSLRRGASAESTAKGAAMMAGFSVGFYSSLSHLKGLCSQGVEFMPMIAHENRNQLRAAWRNAVRKTIS